MSYHRPLSPGGRRIQNPARVSDSFSDPYYTQSRHNSYTSPRTSVGVIPISSQTYVNLPSTSTTRETRPSDRYDSYSGRPRRSSLIDPHRSSVPSVNQLPSRSRPTVVQNDVVRPTSPLKTTSTREKEYYITPASSKEPRKTEHKKLYSVDDGTAKLVADVDIPAGGDRHHRRRNSGVDRGGYKSSGTDKDRGRRDYYQEKPKRSRDKSIDDADAYSYTDAAGMYRDTEPRWRESRPRRGSMDRGGASRERPVSVIEPSYDARSSNKEIGPPVSTRGWDKINDPGVNRSRSVRDPPRVAQSPSRGRYAEPGAYGDQRDPYYVPPRATSNDRRTTTVQHDRPAEPRLEQYEYDERRETRRHERRNSITRASDRSVERRGFGIRSDSKDRFGRGSDESFERQKYRDSGYAEPHRRDTAPELSYHDERRLEQERKDREAALRLQNEDRERLSEREAREKDGRRRDDDRVYERDYDSGRERRERDRDYDRDRERERERERMMERQPDRDSDREKHHHRRENDRDRDYRKENGPRESGDSVVQSGLAKAATGGIAGAAAAFGLNKVFNKGDDRDKDRDKDRDREREREREREKEREKEREQEREAEREREREREKEREKERERERERELQREQERRRDELRPNEREPKQRIHDSHSDEGTFEREQVRPREPERGLGFAFESAPEPPRTAPPERREQKERERAQERDYERDHEDKPSEMPKPALDPDEDYRRRMEQVQRELGRMPEDRQSSDSDPDRERRRLERERRQRERELQQRGNIKLDAGIGALNLNEAPPPPQLRRSFETESDTTTSTQHGLRRRPSILDQPMTDEPAQMAQIIDNSLSEKRENRVRIVDPPTEEEERKPKGILKKPTQKFPEHPNAVREGVAPLKDATKSGIPPGARWTKIDRRLVNPLALEEAKERFEERLDCVIVLRVLTKEEIQKLADRTSEIRDERYEEDRVERKAARKRDRTRDRTEKDEYSDNSEDEYAKRAPRMLEAPPPSSVSGGTAGADADFIRDNRERRRERESEREPQYMSGGLGSRRE